MKNKIKILHVIPVFATGGAERLVLHYARLFDKSKYELHVASCVEDGELRSEFEKLGVSIFVGSRKKMGSRQAVYSELEKYVENIRPDIIHTHLLSSDFFGFNLKRKLKNKIVWVSTLHNVEKATSFVKQILWCYVLSKTDKVVSVGKKVEIFAKREFKVPEGNVQTILNGIDLENWLKVKNTQIFTNKKIQIACVGRLWKQKGHEYLFKALSQIGLEYQLHLFGDGPLKDKLEKLADNLNINNNIVWHGVVKDVYKYLDDIDVVVQPSLWEGLSLVVMETMAAGKIVITTPAGGDELIKDGKTGFIVKSKNSRALAEKIKEVCKNKETVKKVGEGARKFANENFSIEKNVEKLDNLYKSLL